MSDNNDQQQQQQQQQIIIDRDPFYKKSLLATNGPIQNFKNEISFEIMEDLRNKVKDLDKDDWMYEANSSLHFRN